MALHANTYRIIIRPTSTWVQDFYERHKRLPNQAEVDEYMGVAHSVAAPIVIYTSKPHGERLWGEQGKDFLLCAPVGDWNLFYRSWDGKEFKYWTD
jgi:hypothetical protein